MKRRAAGVLSCFALSCLFAQPAAAETRRVAVVVGNNAGAGELAPLRYAEDDAGKVARLLAELGGVAPTDLFLSQGHAMPALREMLDSARARVAAYHARPEDRVLLFFYFSGHSDGEALELGSDRLSYSDLLGWLRSTGADVRVVIVDSCRSGALLAAKGGKPGSGPDYQIRLSDDLAATGQVLLASSAADEAALESSHVKGSVFTYYLVAGLRGAADSSHDGRVTLAEAYQYAYQHTLVVSAQTIIGPQHPGYDYRLSGQGELILTDLSKPSAVLQLPGGFSHLWLFDVRRDQLLADLGPEASRRLAVEAGDYALRAARGSQFFAGRLHVDDRQQLRVNAEDLSVAEPLDSAGKGAPLARVPDAAISQDLPPRTGVAPWVVAGTGGAAVVAAGVLGALVLWNGDQTKTISEGGQPVTQHSFTVAQANAINAEAGVAVGLAVAGGTALATGLLWRLLSHAH